MEKIKTLVVAAAIFASATVGASANSLALETFKNETGLNASQSKIQSTWNDLQAMGTTKFLGGMLGSFKLDESSMLAGALTLGVTQFDSFLKSGKLDISSSDIGSLLSKNMSSAAGLNLSTFTGSFTENGGALAATAASLTTAGSATEASGYCDPQAAQNLVDQANKYVEDMVSVASSDEYGFSALSKGGAGNSGFAGLSCLDKLFQNAGSDIMFKPPSLGALTSKLQNWTCPEAIGIMEQVAGQIGKGTVQTASLGGFFPSLTMPDSSSQAPIRAPGMGNSGSLFGESFDKGVRLSQADIKKTDILSIFK